MRALNLSVAGVVTTVLFFGSVGSVSAQGLFEADPVGLQFEREVRSTYIVRLANALPSQAVNNRASEVAARFGGRIKFVYTNALNGFAITMPSVAMARMTEAGGLDIISVTRDGIVTIDAKPDKPGKPGGGGEEPPAEEPTCDQELPWGVARVTGIGIGIDGCDVTLRGDDAPDYGTSSEAVCVIDTGVDFDHPDLNVNTDPLKMFTAFNKEGYDDLNGHGSHVAGTIGAKANSIGVVGVAPGANIVSVKVLNRRGSGSYSGVIAGVDWMAGEGKSLCSVANMSLGGPIYLPLDNAIICASSTGDPDALGCPENSTPAGITFALAAGNSGADAKDHSPARAGLNNDNIHTIAAMDVGDVWIYFSNYGAAVDYIEPGVNIPSTFKNGGYKTYSGTSMAAPHMAGIVLRDLVNGTSFTINGTVTRTNTIPADVYDIAVSD